MKVPDTEKIPMAASQHEAAVHPVQTPMYPVPQSRGCEKKLLSKIRSRFTELFLIRPWGHQTEKSDLDLVVEFERPIGIMAFVHLKDQITAEIGIPVDLVTPDGLHPLIRNAVMREVIYV